MEYLTAKKFSFTSTALPADTFGVVSFTGTEGLSQCYQFDITLVSENFEIDFADVVQRPATLTFHRKDESTVDYHGLVLRFEQLHEVGGVAFYRAHLAPKLHCLSLTQHNQVFLGQTVEDVVTECLKDGGLTSQDFEFRLQETYDPLDYVCQYAESHLNFVSRWLEHVGIYYFFEQTDQGEKAVFTDTLIAHTAMPQGDKLFYSPPSGLETAHTEEIIKTFSCTYGLTPQSVMLKDYNYRKPSLDVTGTAQVDDKGRGQVYSYGDHIRTPEQGNRLAKTMAEGMLCRREIYEGDGSVPYMTPGFTFTLQDHYRSSFNQTYLTVEVSHEGNQTGFLVAGLTGGQEDESNKVYYRNTFRAIPSSVQFRPERIAVKPRISGVIPGKIDAAGSGQYAEVDAQGRYKVILPFDTSGRKDGKASKWVRMATPYAGSNHGMHFPLHKGTEIILAFVDGDADRPVIVAAVTNPETPSRVNTDNQSMSVIHTGGSNRVAIEDQTGSERILLHSPNQGSYIRIGAPNDPPLNGSTTDNTATTGTTGGGGSTAGATAGATSTAGSTTTGDTGGKTIDERVADLESDVAKLENETSDSGVHIATTSRVDIEGGSKTEIIGGASTEVVGGVESVTVVGGTFYTHGPLLFDTTIGVATDICLGAKWEIHHPEKWEIKDLHMDTEMEHLKSSVETLEANAATKTELNTAVQNVDASVLRSQGDVMTVVAAKTNALASKIETVGNKVDTVANTMHTVASELKTVGSKIESAGSHMQTAGTAVRTHGSRVTTSGTHITQAGTALQSAGSHIRNAALIMDN